MFDKLNFKLLALLLTGLCLFPDFLLAAPWDVDMFRQQSYKPGELSRSPMPNTYPIGSRVINKDTEALAKNLKNPQVFTVDSVSRGQRLWNSNCVTCHGLSGKSDGPSGILMQAPDLTTDFYKAREDGRVFAIMQNGGVNMPRYGYKFSVREYWDLVNYLRFLQGKDLDGIVRPKN